MPNIYHSVHDPLWTEECVSEPECVSVCDKVYSPEICQDIPVTMCSTVHTKNCSYPANNLCSSTTTKMCDSLMTTKCKTRTTPICMEITEEVCETEEVKICKSVMMNK